MMDFKDIKHSDMVAGLAKDGEAIIASMTGESAHALHMAVGISGEAGELLDAIKKFVVYNKLLDRENVVEVHYHLILKDKATGDISKIEEVHPMRHYSEPEIELAAELTGFKVLKVEEFLTREIPSQKTWGVCFILRRD